MLAEESGAIAEWAIESLAASRFRAQVKERVRTLVERENAEPRLRAGIFAAICMKRGGFAIVTSWWIFAVKNCRLCPLHYCRGSKRFALLAALICLTGCEKMPETYAPPVQRQPFENFRPYRITRVVDMSDGDVDSHVVHDILGTGGSILALDRTSVPRFA